MNDTNQIVFFIIINFPALLQEAETSYFFYKPRVIYLTKYCVIPMVRSRYLLFRDNEICYFAW